MRKVPVFLTLCVSSLLPAQQRDFEALPRMHVNLPQREFTRLLDGRVLVSGGCDVLGQICRESAEAEILDPATKSWKRVSSLIGNRTNHIAVLLPNRRVLVAGGLFRSNALSTVEFYDADADRWEPGPSMPTPRQYLEAVTLQDGRILTVGGFTGTGNRFRPVSSAEIFDPATNSWQATSNMREIRALFTLTLLPDGRVLAAGGTTTLDVFNGLLDSAEIYDPATGAWSDAGKMGRRRIDPGVAVLPDGRVLVAGGNDSPAPTRSTDLFDPATLTWSAGPEMRVERGQPTAILLPSGQVFVAGGFDAGDSPLRSTEVYDPETNIWSDGPAMNSPRGAATALILDGGYLLLAGSFDPELANTAELLRTVAPAAGRLIAVPTASYSDNQTLAPDSHAAAFGSDLHNSTIGASGAMWPTTLDGLSLAVRDSQGATRAAPLGLVSRGQINFLVPSATAAGLARLTLSRAGNVVATGEVSIAGIAPALFSADGSGRGRPAALVVRVRDGRQTVEPLRDAVALGTPGEQVALVLYASGLRGAKQTVVTFAGRQVPVLFTGPSPEFPGVDQVNVLLPNVPASGPYLLTLTGDQRVSNTLTVVADKVP